MSPWLYISRRLLQAVPLFFGIISITFLLIHTAPGSPITFLAGEYGTDPAYIAKIERMFGLDKPLYIQLFKYIVQVCKGELGFSFIYMQPVSTIIFKRMGTTLQLMALVILFSTFFGVMLGVVSSKKPYSLLDNITNTLSLVGYSIPVFWMGQLLLLFFALKLSWLPTGGLKNLRVDYTGIRYALDLLYHLILPAMALGSIHTALIARMQRASMLEELGQDYIITARAKGLKENAVIYKHALRNALLPVVTVIGFTMGYMITGAVLTETVFGLPGLGTMMKDAIYQRDYPIIMAVFVFSSIFTIIANLITDIAYSFLDPRIRYQ